MTHFVIHVGPHKTGSSYLQEGFAKLRPQLEERGVFYPRLWGQKAHHKLVECLMDVANPKLEADFIQIHAANYPVVLISVEGLTALRDPSVLYFKRLLGDAKVTIVFYARSWADLLPSHWKEEVKGGRSIETFPEYIWQRLSNPATSRLVNFGEGLSLYAQLFGRESIKIVSYDQVLANGLDLFDHFVKTFLDLKDLPDAQLTRVNVSPSPVDAEIIRSINALNRTGRVSPGPSKYGRAFADAYMARRQDIADSVLITALEHHTGSLWINEATGSLHALHQELIEKFGYALVAPRLARYFFKPRRADVRYIQPNYIYEPGVLAELRSLHSALVAERKQPAVAK